MSHASDYIDAIAWGRAVTFQTFDDTQAKRRSLAQIFHGTLEQHQRTLMALNREGAGIFVTVNQTDLTGRKSHNIIELRALFTDDDSGGEGTGVVPPVPASFRVLSANGPHTYFLLEMGEDRSRFKEAQKRLAAYMGTDPKVHDLPRVMRCPGFYNCKAERFPVTFEQGTAARYTIDQVLSTLPPVPIVERKQSPSRTAYENAQNRPEGDVSPWWEMLRRPICKGSRNDELFRIACRMRKDGMGGEEIHGALMAVNERLCDEPVPAVEVETIARNVSAY